MNPCVLFQMESETTCSAHRISRSFVGSRICDARIMVMNGGLAPGGTVSCECGGEGFDPGITSVEYVQAMRTAVPDLFARLDAWASHSYPANGLGYGLVLIAVAFGCLTHAFVTSDFSVLNVAQNSHSTKPMLYKVSGVWGNHEGSMLLWVLILALFGSAVALFGRNLPPGLQRALTMLRQRLDFLSDSAAQRRLITVCFMFLNLLAVYTRDLESGRASEDFDEALEDTIRQIVAALFLPVRQEG